MPPITTDASTEAASSLSRSDATPIEQASHTKADERDRPRLLPVELLLSVDGQAEQQR
jgi:hypothetical protein